MNSSSVKTAQAAVRLACRRQQAAKLRSRSRPRSVQSAASFTYEPPPFAPEEVPDLEFELPEYSPSNDAVDVVISGAGPAGVATAARLGSQGLSVVVVDPAPLQHWPNNYGVWIDEFEAMGLQDCFEYEWSKANVWLSESDERCGCAFPAFQCRQP